MARELLLSVTWLCSSFSRRSVPSSSRHEFPACTLASARLPSRCCQLRVNGASIAATSSSAAFCAVSPCLQN